jgi:aconitase A
MHFATIRPFSGQHRSEAQARPTIDGCARILPIPNRHSKARQTAPGVSFDINPTSREILPDLTKIGAMRDLVIGGARIHQAGCTGCIGMGQAPATGRNSLRTMPRNFPGRSGTKEDSVWLCSPETAAASALTGVITDPREWAREVKIADFDDDVMVSGWRNSLDEVLCIAQSDRRPRAVHAGGRSRAELSDRRVIDTPVRTQSVNRQYGRCDPVTFTKIVNSLRASRQEIIVHYHEAAIRNFVIERVQSFNRRFIHIAIKPQYS